VLQATVKFNKGQKLMKHMHSGEPSDEQKSAQEISAKREHQLVSSA
jgi:hypothetical protein